MDETVEYMGECYPSLTREQLGELRLMGVRFCQPVIDTVQPEATADEGQAEEASEVAA